MTALAQGSKGRDARKLTALREKFIMLSHADREANLPPAFRAGSVLEDTTADQVRPSAVTAFPVLMRGP